MTGFYIQLADPANRGPLNHHNPLFPPLFALCAAPGLLLTVVRIRRSLRRAASPAPEYVSFWDFLTDGSNLMFVLWFTLACGSVALEWFGG